MNILFQNRHIKQSFVFYILTLLNYLFGYCVLAIQRQAQCRGRGRVRTVYI